MKSCTEVFSISETNHISLLPHKPAMPDAAQESIPHLQPPLPDIASLDTASHSEDMSIGMDGGSASGSGVGADVKMGSPGKLSMDGGKSVSGDSSLREEGEEGEVDVGSEPQCLQKLG